MKRKMELVLVCAMAFTVLVGCNKKPRGGGKPTIGIPMPTKEQPIWAANGNRLVEIFSNAGYQTIIEFAEDTPERQIMQIENMITRGAKYIVTTPVDSYSLTDVCGKAKDAGVTVISEGRLIMNTENVDYYVTFDLLRMGEFLGEGIENGLGLKEGKKGPFTLEIFSGSPDDNASVPFYEGSMAVLRKYLDDGTLVVKSGQTSLDVTGTLKWDSAIAQARMDHNIFHMDGKGVAKHLDEIIKLPKLNAIQWVQGLGEDQPIMQWVPLVKKIQAAGKGVVVDLMLNELDAFMSSVSPKGIYLCIETDNLEEEQEVLKKLEKWV
ncbi:MAG: substrate-binding domain-containing protein [Treponema sp.]|jgi:ABC-type xylose transport system substrate-binding protein|nr:substrate-binding domain-containing protein [Treponema sp.]